MSACLALCLINDMVLLCAGCLGVYALGDGFTVYALGLGAGRAGFRGGERDLGFKSAGCVWDVWDVWERFGSKARNSAVGLGWGTGGLPTSTGFLVRLCAAGCCVRPGTKSVTPLFVFGQAKSICFPSSNFGESSACESVLVSVFASTESFDTSDILSQASAVLRSAWCKILVCCGMGVLAKLFVLFAFGTEWLREGGPKLCRVGGGVARQTWKLFVVVG